MNGKAIKTGKKAKQLNPSNHAQVVCEYHEADEAIIADAIEGSLKAKEAWEYMPWSERASIGLKIADLIANKYRYKLLAATMIGQGKNAWQAEIDAGAEICDFLRFGVKYIDDMYQIQPLRNAPAVWNRTEYRALEGFVLAVTPFNFTAIAGNLPMVPILVGNVVVWKPSPMSVYSNYLLYQIFEEAGVPPGVLQFVPGPAEDIVGAAIKHREFAGLHFTGSTQVFRMLWRNISNNLEIYRSYPRIVGETGGKNFHFVHKSANIDAVVNQSIRAAYEYAGQKCSALGRLYVPKSLWEGGLKNKLIDAVRTISVGPAHEFRHFVGPVIAKHSFEKITRLIDEAKAAGGEVLVGGTADDSKGYYIQPTVIETKDPKSVTMVQEIFGPVITVYAYPDDDVDGTCKLVDETTQYALTGSIFASDRYALTHISNLLRNASGMMYFNDKCTGAVVGQQPFGGARGSGTNDKAGSMNICAYSVLTSLPLRLSKDNQGVNARSFDVPLSLECRIMHLRRTKYLSIVSRWRFFIEEPLESNTEFGCIVAAQNIGYEAAFSLYLDHFKCPAKHATVHI